MVVKAKDLFALVEEWAPLEMAGQGDNPGLQLGDPQREVKRLLLALDVDQAALREAVEKDAQAVISHHPLFFKPLSNLRIDQPPGALVASLLKFGITVYAAHTNLDNAGRGVSDELARRLNLREVDVLAPVWRQKFLKLVTFVPFGYEEKVRAALGEAGAGCIGNYHDCFFQTAGKGTFRPGEETAPFIGKPGGDLERVDEVRLETILPAELAGQVRRALLAAHPYEEVAYDLYPLANEGKAAGTGRVGLLPQPMPFGDFVEKVKNALEIKNLRCGGEQAREIRRVAVCGGSGGGLWPIAYRAGADVFVTGDINYHAAKEMSDAGINFVDAGHFGTEQIILPVLRSYLARRCQEKGWECEIFLGTQADPFLYL